MTAYAHTTFAHAADQHVAAATIDNADLAYLPNATHQLLVEQMASAPESERRVSIIVPAQAMARPGFAGLVVEAAVATEVDLDRLEFEIEEYDLHWCDDLEPTLCDLHELGARIAIDRFGTGLTSLSALAHLPIATIKIDESIVAQVTCDEDVANYARAMIDVARHLRIDVIALGATSSEQQAFFKGAGCSNFQ